MSEVSRRLVPNAFTNEDYCENIKESIIVPDDTSRDGGQTREPRMSEMNLKQKMNNPHSTKTN